MVIKYRVHEVAKDFDVPSKDVIDFLGEHFDDPKQHMTALTDDELNIIFEHLTKENEVDSFDPYFAMIEKKEEKKPQSQTIRTLYMSHVTQQPWVKEEKENL